LRDVATSADHWLWGAITVTIAGGRTLIIMITIGIITGTSATNGKNDAKEKRTAAGIGATVHTRMGGTGGIQAPVCGLTFRLKGLLGQTFPT
jgi:hypothetical protein